MTVLLEFPCQIIGFVMSNDANKHTSNPPQVKYMDNGTQIKRKIAVFNANHRRRHNGVSMRYMEL